MKPLREIKNKKLEKPFTCQKCGKKLNDVQSHLKRTHNYDFEEIKQYYDYYYKLPEEGYCIMTGEPTKFISFGHGYAAYSNSEKARKIKNATTSKQYYLNKGYSEEEANQILKNNGKQRGKKIKNTFKQKEKQNPGFINSMSKYCKEFWIEKGYDEEKAKELAWSETEKNRQKFQQKKQQNPEQYKDIYSTQLEYWINKRGYDEETAKQKLSERQATFTLEKCIKRHGKKKGYQIWQNRQEKWKAKVFNEERNITNGRSDLADKFFNKLIKMLEKEGYNTNHIKCFDNEKFIHWNGKNYMYDFCYKPKRKIIEFNGDFWHCNPKIYNYDYYHNIIEKTAQQIWRKDRIKELIAKYYGYEVLIIWEYDLNNYPEHIINQVINFI